MSNNKQPNIVLVISDQHHPRFMGCAGEPLVQTPNLDRLASRGVRFENAYCSFPLCCPSRMSFLSAQMPSTINCLDNHRQLDSDTPTFAHAFNAAGYETVLCGRMHINGPDQRHGFQRRLIGDVLGTYEQHFGSLKHVLGPELAGTCGPSANAIRVSGKGDSAYLEYDRAVTDEANKYLRDRDANSDDPFMMVVGYVQPHAPFVALPEDYELYESKITIDDLPKHDPNRLHPEMHRLQRRAKLEDADPVSLEDQRRARIAYYGMCTYLDRMVGEVMDSVEAAGIADNTIFIYTSDHGEQLGEHGMWWKHTFYDGSVGIPMIVAPPVGRDFVNAPNGTAAKANVSLMDVGPTMLDLADAPSLPTAEGKSFRCVLDGDSTGWDDTVLSENLWPPDADCYHRMVKRGPWKLCHYHGFDPQLFNLEEDPSETIDHANDPEHRDILDELMQIALHEWDHDQIMQRHRDLEAVRPWLKSALEGNDMPEPNEPWHHSRKINNWVNKDN